MKWLLNLWKPIKIIKLWNEIVATMFNPLDWCDDYEFVTDYAISDVLPLSYDWEFWIDSSFRFLDSNDG